MSERLCETTSNRRDEKTVKGLSSAGKPSNWLKSFHSTHSSDLIRKFV